MRPEAERTRTNLIRIAEGISDWTPLSEAVALGIIAFLEVTTPGRSTIDHILQTIGGVRFGTPPSSPELTDPKQWAESYFHIAAAIRNPWPEALEGDVLVSCNPLQWFEISGQLFLLDPEQSLSANVRPRLTEEQVDTALAGTVGATEWIDRLPGIFDFTKGKFGVGSEWPAFNHAIEARTNEPSVPYDDIAKLLKSIWPNRTTATTNKVYEAITGLPNFFLLFQEAFAASSFDDASIYALVAARNGSADVNASWTTEHQNAYRLLEQHITQNATENRLIDSIVTFLESIYSGSSLFELLARAKPLVTASLKNAAGRDEPWRVLPTDLFFNRKQDISSALQDFNDYNAFIQKMMSQSEFLDALKTTPFDVRLFDAAAAAGALSDEEFSLLCVSGLTQSAEESWRPYFHSDVVSRPILLLRKILADEIPISLGESFINALNEYASEVAQGTETRAIHVTDLDALLTAVPPDQLDGHKKSLLILAMENGSKISDSFFKIFGQQISDVSLLRSNPDVLPLLVIPLVRDRKEAGLRWLKSVLDSDDSLFLSGFRQRDIKDLGDAVNKVDAYKVTGGATGLVRSMKPYLARKQSGRSTKKPGREQEKTLNRGGIFRRRSG